MRLLSVYDEGKISRGDKFSEIVHQSANIQDGRHCLTMPFREKHPRLPNNLSMAKQRLQGLKKGFKSDK